MSAASFFLEDFEIAELVEAQDAQLPQVGIENIAFVDQQLAADHLVASGGVAGEIDAPDEELMALVEGQRQIDFVGIGDRLKGRLGHEIDIAELPVELAADR